MIISMQKVTYQILGLHCGACVNRVKQALLASASEVEVTLTPAQVTLFNPKHSLEQLNDLLAPIGDYHLRDIHTQSNWLATAKQWLAR